MPVTLTQPAEDSLNWAAHLNKNFQDLETLLNQVEADLNTAEAAIISNAANIATNVTNIATNVTAIAVNAAALGYHDRGDLTDYDFDQTDMTTDGTWRALDLSALVPQGTTAVNVMVHLLDNLADQNFKLRKHGNAQAANVAWQGTNVANMGIELNATVAVDADRKIDYWAENTTWTRIWFIVCGYWKGA